MNERIEKIAILMREKLSLGQTLDDAEIFFRPLFGKGDVDLAISLVKSEDPHLAGEVAPVQVKDKLDFFGWYRGPSNKSESHWSLLKDHLQNKESPWTEEMVKSLDLASNSVVNHLVPPKSVRPLTSKGLVLGYIQSGKTANFSAVIAKAVDEGYKLVVVLSGMHNNLRLQTQARLQEEIHDLKPESCITLSRVDEKGDFDKRQSISANRALGTNDGFALVVLKKNTHVLRAFNNWLTKAKKDILENTPTLIIDDESDQASINTNKPENSPTAINSKIREMVSFFNKVSFVGYTATPFANLLIDGSDEDDLYPKDFFINLEKPPTYFGPTELFGRLGVNGDEEQKPMPVLRAILDEATLDENKNLIPPESLYQAVRSFLISGVLRLLRGQRNSHITMLVHTSHLKDEHGKWFSWVENYIKELILIFDEVTTLPNNFKTLIENDHGLTTKFILGESSTFKEKLFIKEIKSFLEKIELILENSTSSERLSFDRVEPLYGIIVGGNTLSRGLTIEGLTTSYFARSTKQYDTLLQMGRWFGYRKGYVDLTRIYVTDDMREYFYALATVEKDIRDEIESMAANEERPIDVALRIRSFPGLKVTSGNKMRSATKSSFTFSGTKIQIRSVNIKEQNIIDKNIACVNSLLNKIESSDSIEMGSSDFDEWEKSVLYKNVNPELVVQFLDEFNFYSENINFSKKLGIQYITDMNKNGELNKWSIAIMSSKKGTAFKLGNDKDIFLVSRSAFDKNYGKEPLVTLRSLVPPLNELIDMFDVIPTKGGFKNSSEFKEWMKENKLTDTILRKNLRPKERGLLLIYPLDPKFENNKTVNSVTEDKPIYAVSLVFPSSKNDIGFLNYIENESI